MSHLLLFITIRLYFRVAKITATSSSSSSLLRLYERPVTATNDVTSLFVFQDTLVSTNCGKTAVWSYNSTVQCSYSLSCSTASFSTTLVFNHSDGRRGDWLFKSWNIQNVERSFAVFYWNLIGSFSAILVTWLRENCFRRFEYSTIWSSPTQTIDVCLTVSSKTITWMFWVVASTRACCYSRKWKFGPIQQNWNY